MAIPTTMRKAIEGGSTCRLLTPIDFTVLQGRDRRSIGTGGFEAV